MMYPFLYALLGFCHKYPLNYSTYILLYYREFKLRICLKELNDSPLLNLLKILFLL